MLVLGVESSCDDTSVAVVSDDHQILSNVIFSQIDLHNVFGGVVPEIAARAHVDSIDLTYREAIKKAGISVDDIDYIAATCGPGLIGGVIVGSTFAKTLSAILGKPFVPVNHIEAHATSARLECKDLKFPYLLLLASGGHCIICVVENVKSFRILGQTIDDSVGECFDKTAKMLGLSYPGGPIIEKLAKEGDCQKYKLPHPLCDKKTCDMSFSGLKTAVRNIVQSDNFSEQNINDMCASLQQTLCDVLTKKVALALEMCEVKSIVVSGGVAANLSIRQKLSTLAESKGLKFFAPSMKICTDNAAMIAWNAIEQIKSGDFANDVNFRPTPRWPLQTSKI